jgi:indole-3-glycerol phosphate synthase
MTILEEIVENKRQEVEILKQKESFEKLKTRVLATDFQPTKLFKKRKSGLIAEIKKRSPSKGTIRENFDPKFLAKEFEAGGASAISVLTDQKYFGGSNEVFTEVRNIVDLPLLRKEFIVDIYQIFETRALEADLILLLVNVLGDELEVFLETALNLNLQPLIETHTKEEIDFVLKTIQNLENKLQKNLDNQGIIIGINNRNLKNFDLSIQNSLDLVSNIPEKYFRLAESGIFTTKDLETLDKAGFNGFLIGEGLAKNPNLWDYF